MTDTYDLIRAATLARRQVVATYKGHRRELCPHVLGTKEGRRQALFFQFGGGSSSALPPGGEWRCIPLNGLEDVVVRDGPWHTGVLACDDYGLKRPCAGSIPPPPPVPNRFALLHRA